MLLTVLLCLDVGTNISLVYQMLEYDIMETLHSKGADPTACLLNPPSCGPLNNSTFGRRRGNTFPGRRNVRAAVREQAGQGVHHIKPHRTSYFTPLGTCITIELTRLVMIASQSSQKTPMTRAINDKMSLQDSSCDILSDAWQHSSRQILAAAPALLLSCTFVTKKRQQPRNRRHTGSFQQYMK